MWDFTEDDKRRVEEIYQHFLPLYPNIDKKLLYDRILSGYCYVENGLWLETIEDWEIVFNESKLPEHIRPLWYLTNNHNVI